MNTKHHLNHLKLALIVGSLALPLIAQAGLHPRYSLIDVGTFGGGRSTVIPGRLSNRSTVVGEADTTVPDPNFDAVANSLSFLLPNPFIEHAFKLQHGIVADLGALPGVNSSQAFAVNAAGDIVGYSENGVIDPLLAIPELRAVLWRDGRIIDLGTLGGNESVAAGINQRGQIAGSSANLIPDEFSYYDFGTQTRAFLWENGVMQDLGTLGGPDAVGEFLNERGQVAGESFTDWTPNPTTGIPTVHPFLWEDDRILDLGTLGGTFAGLDALNNRGQAVGASNLAGDLTTHPILWDGKSLRDLGTFGGDNGEAVWLNDAGEVVGVADLPNG